MRATLIQAAVVAATLGLCSAVQAANGKDRVAKCLARYSGQDRGRNRTTVYKTDFPGVTWDDDNWLLSTTTLEQGRYQSRGSVANGYFGISVASVGPFFELDAEDEGGDLHISQAVVDLEIVPSVDANATVVNVLDGYSAVRTDFVQSGEDAGAIYSAVRPTGIANVTAYIYANMTGSDDVDIGRKTLVSNKPYIRKNESSIAQAVPVTFSAGKAVRITKYVGAASGDAFDDPQQVAKNAASSALSQGFYKSLRSHVQEWDDVMPDHSVDSYADPDNGTLPQDSYIIDSAIIAVANTYYLLQSTVGPNAQSLVKDAPVNVDSISVGGLVSDSYAGLIFWDADLFMQPGLVVSHPQSAERITNYRVNKYGQAKANAQTSYTSSQNKTVFSKDAAAFPWTSGRFGNCTATGPCWDYQYHLNGDIGISFVNQLVATGDTRYFNESLFPVYDSIATLFSNLLAPNGSSWTVKNMTDPDEYANHVDAGGYTMPLIAETLQTANTFREQFGLEKNATWDSMATNVLFLRENGVTLEFTTMNGSAVVKQADVILNTFPLSYTTNYTTQESLNDLDYYANKQSPDGPAMTWAFFSIIANDISPSGCSAYTYSQYSYKPYARAPFYQLSEQLIDNATINGGTHPAYPFLTGHGGANQVNVFGYLGLRLLPDDTLHINPNLPPQLSHLRYRTFYWRGWPFAASSNATHTTVRRARHVRPLPSADPRFANATITIDAGADGNATAYRLPVDGAAVVPNRNIGRINTTPGNLLQCRSADSPGAHRPGQFPIGAVDGATSTKWQPQYAANLSAVTVMLAPGDVGAMAVPAARYATLLIVGNQGLGQRDVDAKNGTGATVAEWAIISDERRKMDGEAAPAKMRRSLTWREEGMLMGRPY
ncbi:Acid trehalase [Metarhizium anisopliae]